VLYQMAMFPMTLGDPLPPNRTNFCIFRCPSDLRIVSKHTDFVFGVQVDRT